MGREERGAIICNFIVKTFLFFSLSLVFVHFFPWSLGRGGRAKESENGFEEAEESFFFFFTPTDTKIALDNDDNAPVTTTDCREWLLETRLMVRTKFL
jgi:hypothetical protein